MFSSLKVQILVEGPRLLASTHGIEFVSQLKESSKLIELLARGLTVSVRLRSRGLLRCHFPNFRETKEETPLQQRPPPPHYPLKQKSTLCLWRQRRRRGGNGSEEGRNRRKGRFMGAASLPPSLSPTPQKVYLVIYRHFGSLEVERHS